MDETRQPVSHYVRATMRSYALEALNRLMQLRQSQHVRPDFIIIGAPKCGTTSLYDYLIQHPQVKPALKKEIYFFDKEFARGEGWYSGHFQIPKPGFITGEASTTYIFTPTAPSRIRAYAPETRLIALLRDPLDRAISHYYHNVRVGRENLTFYEAFEQETPRIEGEREVLTRRFGCWHPALSSYAYVHRSLYADQLPMWLDLFPAEQLLTLKSEDFFTKPEQTYFEVCQFLNLPEYGLADYKPQNVGGSNNIDETFIEQHRRFFHPYNERLKALTGIDFGWQ